MAVRPEGIATLHTRELRLGQRRLMRHVEHAGRYLRVADPDWVDPLSGAYARHRGGRWNPPGAFDVVY